MTNMKGSRKQETGNLESCNQATIAMLKLLPATVEGVKGYLRTVVFWLNVVLKSFIVIFAKPFATLRPEHTISFTLFDF